MWGALERIYDSKIIYGSLGIRETVKKDNCILVNVMSKAEKSLRKGVTISAKTVPVQIILCIDLDKYTIFSQ